MFPPNWQCKDQEKRGTCAAFALAACRELRAYTNGVRENGGPISLSEQYLYWGAKQIDKKPGDDWTILEHAAEALDTKGVCRWPLWPYQLPPAQPGQDPVTLAWPTDPPLGADADASNYRHGKTYRTYPSAAMVELALRQAESVALTVSVLYLEDSKSQPIVYTDPDTGLPLRANNWLNDYTVSTGLVLDEKVEPRHSYVDRDTAHVVCVGQFLTDRAAPGGGWFLVRNSLGARWGLSPSYPGKFPGRGVSPPPWPKGYGFISAWYVHKRCKEMVVLPKTKGNPEQSA